MNAAITRSIARGAAMINDSEILKMWRFKLSAHKVSTQGPGHCRIDFCKRVSSCINNKDVFVYILRHHVSEGHLQKLQADLAGEDGIEEEPNSKAED